MSYQHDVNVAVEKASKKLRASSKEEKISFFVKAGIINKDLSLSRSFGGIKAAKKSSKTKKAS